MALIKRDEFSPGKLEARESASRSLQPGESLQSQLGAPNRNAVIDLFRGLALVLMTINHLPHTVLNHLSWEPVGFISSAESFVFLSGLVTGLVYGRTAILGGMRALLSRTLLRFRTVYLSYVLVLTGAVLAAKAGIPSLGPHVHVTWTIWLQAIFGMIAPGYSEVLRLYLFLFLLIPPAIWALRRNKTVYVITGSAALWIIAAKGYGLSAFPDKYGYFDPLSWQLLFVAGIVLGFKALRGELNIRNNRMAIALSVAVATMLLVIRHWQVFAGVDFNPYFAWSKEWRRTIGIARLINFITAAYLVYRYRIQFNRFAKTLAGRPLAFLGQHSLQVFVWSVTISMLVWGEQGRWESMSRAEQICSQLLVIASCFIPAWLHRESRRDTSVVRFSQRLFEVRGPHARKSESSLRLS